MERRDLAAAKRWLAPGFTMVFPGNRRFDTLEQLVGSARGNDMAEVLGARVKPL